MRKHQKGFTLVEIMIVVVIIGLLAIMAIPAFNKVRTTSQQNAITNNLRQLANAAEQYFLTTGITQVTSAALVGTNSTQYIKTMQTIAGETYPATITQGFTSLTPSTPGACGAVYYNN